MPCAGVLMNQMHPILGHKIDPIPTLGATAHAHAHDLGEHTVNQFLARLGANHRRLIGLAHAEQALADQLKSLLTDSLPNLELLKSYENLSLEEERIYYEYYANENDSLVRFNLVSVQEQLQSLSNRINTLYRQSESFALIDQAHGFITVTGESFIANLQSSQTDWDLAREQLDIISATRRDIKAALAHQISNHTRSFADHY